MPHKLFNASIISIGALAASILISTSVFAVNYPNQFNSSWRQNQATRSEGENPSEERSCKAKEALIKNLLDKVVSRVNSALTKFDSITSRVKDYYTNKVVPSGKTVPNYENLVADIQDKKTAAEALLATTQADIGAFSCNSSNPKGQIAKIRGDVKNLKKALKDYRTSVKNLIVAVRSITGTESREDRSPKPSHSPRPTSSPRGENNND